MDFGKYIFVFFIFLTFRNDQCEGNEFDLHIHRGIKMIPKETDEGSLFGFALAIKNNMLFVGDPGYDERKGGAFYCNLHNCTQDCSCSSIKTLNEKGNPMNIIIL